MLLGSMVKKENFFMGRETFDALLIEMLFDRKLIHKEWICLEATWFTFMILLLRQMREKF